MSDASAPPTGARRKALEIAMRNALDGMEDLAAQFAVRSTPGAVQILSVQADRPGLPGHRRAQVYRVPLRRSSDVVAFLIEREYRALKLSA